MKRTMAQHAKIGAMVRMDSGDNIPEYRVKTQKDMHTILVELDWEHGGEEIDEIAVADTATLFVIE